MWWWGEEEGSCYDTAVKSIYLRGPMMTLAWVSSCVAFFCFPCPLCETGRQGTWSGEDGIPRGSGQGSGPVFSWKVGLPHGGVPELISLSGPCQSSREWFSDLHHENILWSLSGKAQKHVQAPWLSLSRVCHSSTSIPSLTGSSELPFKWPNQLTVPWKQICAVTLDSPVPPDSMGGCALCALSSLMDERKDIGFSVSSCFLLPGNKHAFYIFQLSPEVLHWSKCPKN